LPSQVAALTPLPVIGVPVKSSMLSGNDSLLSIVQARKRKRKEEEGGRVGCQVIDAV
jgi:NCAIR mutase (PurE)-related protein